MSSLTSYKIAELPDIDFSLIGVKRYERLEIEVVDTTADYIDLMKEVFDFNSIRKFFRRHSDYKFLFDGMHGITGPYGIDIFQKELGLPQSCTINCEPRPNVGGRHFYPKDLLDSLGRFK